MTAAAGSSTRLRDRTPTPRLHAGLGPGRLRQDDAARRLAAGGPTGARPARRVGVPRRARQRRRPRSGPTWSPPCERAVPGVGADGAGAPAVGASRRSRPSSPRSQRAQRPPGRRRPGPRRLPPRRRPRRPRRAWPSCSTTCRRSVHLVISTRADPPLPLARLRARGELVEVRAADLRFTADEAAAYLNDVDRPRPDRRRHRGPRGAAPRAGSPRCSSPRSRCSGRDDVGGFIAGFAGDDRYVVDYLAEEVLRPPARRRSARFLLETSVLDRLTGPLCDAVTGERRRQASCSRRWSAQPVPRPARRPPPLVPLPPPVRRRAARPPARRAARATSPTCTAAPAAGTTEHGRAAAGGPARAGRRATSTAAADLVELAIPALRRERREAVIRRWVDDLPDEVVARPAGAGHRAHRRADGQQRVRRRRPAAGRHRAAAGAARHGDAGRSSTATSSPACPAAIEMYRAALALIARRPGRHHRPRRAGARPRRRRTTTWSAPRRPALSGLASWTDGDLEAAHRRLRRRAGGPRRGPGTSPTCSAARSRWPTWSSRRAGSATPSAPSSDALSSRTATASGRLPAGHRGHARRPEPGRLGARRPGRRGASTCAAPTSSGEAAGLPQNPYRWRVAMAPLRAAEGDLRALELLDEAERVYVGDFSPNVQPVTAHARRVLAAHGDVAGPLALGTRARAGGRRRAVVPARVRARHPGAGPARRARGDRV